MPIYEFVCRQCGHRFECLTKVGGEKEITCPACGSSEITKVFSSFGIGGGSNRLKGASTNACSTCSSRTCSTCR